MASHIKKGETVMVIAGEDKGSKGKVLRVDGAKGVVVVEGINRVHKHVRPSKKNPQGGRLQVERPINISNVLPVNPKTGNATRVRFEQKDGKKVRVAVEDGTTLDVVKK